MSSEELTQHTCGGPKFGRLTPDCPRCDELAAGAQPRTSWRSRRQQTQETQQRAHQAHFAPNGPHARGACGPVCTFGDW